MTKIVWDKVGEKRYETGVDRGVLYLPDGSGVPWNGLISVEEDKGDVSVEAFYFEGVKYLQTRTSGDYSGSLTAYTYPEEFERFDGLEEIDNGILLGNQPVNETFAISYRTLIGNDVDGLEHGYKIHVIYNLTAAPDSLQYETVSDSPDATEMGWTITATPEFIPGHKPTAHLIFDTTKLNPFLVKDIEALLYGKDPVLISLPNDRLDGGTAASPIDNVLGDVDTVILDGGTPFFAESLDLIDGGTPASASTLSTDEFTIATPDAKLPPMAQLVDMVTKWTLIAVTDNGDGTWTAEGPDELITMLNSSTFQIDRANATYLDADTYEIETAHGFEGG